MHLLKSDFAAFCSDPRSPLRAEHACSSVIRLPSNAKQGSLLSDLSLWGDDAKMGATGHCKMNGNGYHGTIVCSTHQMLMPCEVHM